MLSLTDRSWCEVDEQGWVTAITAKKWWRRPLPTHADTRPEILLVTISKKNPTRANLVNFAQLHYQTVLGIIFENIFRVHGLSLGLLKCIANKVRVREREMWRKRFLFGDGTWALQIVDGNGWWWYGWVDLWSVCFDLVSCQGVLPMHWGVIIP